MNNNEADITDESIEVPSPQRKFMPFLHQIPALKMNKSKLLAKILHGQLQNSPSQVFTPKKTPKTPQVPSSPQQERHPALTQMMNKYRLSEVGSASKINPFKDEIDSSLKKDLMPEISPKSQSQALKEMYKASIRSKPQSGQFESVLPSVRKSMGNIVLADPELDFLPLFGEKPKGNEKNPSSNDVGTLKGVFFSDSRNRASVYEKRFITLKAKGQAESNHNMFMPKIKQKHDIVSPKPANKHSSQESYTATATDSLGLNIHVKSSLQEGSTQKLVWSGEEKMTSQYSQEKSLKTNKSHRRITSVGMPTGLTHSSDKEATITLSKIASKNSPNNKKFTTNTEGKSIHLNTKKSVNEDKKSHQNLLETNRQTFQFEKKAVVQEEQKDKGADLRLSLGASLIAKRIGCENFKEQIKLKPITKDQKEKLMAMLTKDNKDSNNEAKNKKESLKYVESKIDSIETERLRSSRKFEEKEENSLQDLVQMMEAGEKQKKHDYSFEKYELSEEFMKNEEWGRSSQGTLLNEKIFAQQRQSIIKSNKSPKNLKMKINIEGKKK